LPFSPIHWIAAQCAANLSITSRRICSVGPPRLGGRSLALTLSIFIQGLNVIIRLMMFFSQAKPENGPWDVPYIIASLVGIALSTYLMFRLDRGDVRPPWSPEISDQSNERTISRTVFPKIERGEVKSFTTLYFKFGVLDPYAIR
jgi:hypothetical protein